MKNPEAGVRVLEETINGCRKRQRESQETLYREFHGYGMSITLRYASSRQQAVSILNDAFLRAFDKIGSFDTGRPFKPWFRQIVIHTAIDHFRRTSRQSEMYAWGIRVEEIAVDPSALSSIAYNELIELVHRLSPAYRTVFNLYAVEGYKHEEIADMLSISVGTSKSNLAKARRNLREMIRTTNAIHSDVT